MLTEATFEVLPRLNEIKFGSGVIDELLFLDWPREYRYPSGIMMLEYAKAVQESVYEQLRVVREGRLRIIFAHDLKVICEQCLSPPFWTNSNISFSVSYLFLCSYNATIVLIRYSHGNFVLAAMRNFFLGVWLHHR